MRLFILLLFVVSLSGCSTTYLSPERMNALSAMSAEERAPLLLRELEALPEGYQSTVLEPKIQLINMAFDLQNQNNVYSKDQLDRFLVIAMELDPVADKKNGFSRNWLYLGASGNQDLLRAAAKDNDSGLITAILNNGVSPLPDQKPSPLVYAAKNTDARIVNLLLQAQFDPDGDALDRNDPMQVPLYVACRYGKDPDIVSALLKAGSTASLEQAKAYAIANPHGGEITSVLISAGTEIDDQSLDKALLNAFEHRKVDSANRFIALGADPRRVQNELGAIEPRTVEMVGFQYAWCGQPVPGYERALSRAVEKNNLKMAGALFAAEASPNQHYTQGLLNVKVPLIWDVVDDGRAEMLKLFLFSGADPNAAWGDQTILDCLIRKMGYVDGVFANKNDQAALKKYQEMAADIRALGGKPRKTAGGGGFDLFMKTAVTVAVGATIASSDIDAYHGTDIFSATVQDVWGSGEGNALASLNEQYANGDLSIKDPELAKLLEQQQAMERMQDQAVADMKRKQAEQNSNSADFPRILPGTNQQNEISSGGDSPSKIYHYLSVMWQDDDGNWHGHGPDTDTWGKNHDDILNHVDKYGSHEFLQKIDIRVNGVIRNCEVYRSGRYYDGRESGHENIRDSYPELRTL